MDRPTCARSPTQKQHQPSAMNPARSATPSGLSSGPLHRSPHASHKLAKHFNTMQQLVVGDTPARDTHHLVRARGTTMAGISASQISASQAGAHCGKCSHRNVQQPAAKGVSTQVNSAQEQCYILVSSPLLHATDRNDAGSGARGQGVAPSACSNSRHRVLAKALPLPRPSGPRAL